ncbi:MAG: hypothetical protein IT462_05910 [Planctomycetes bacterium]|nr:hypothetical protein [Planctomycetota bacterium]
MRPATMAAMVILAAVLLIPAFLLRIEPYQEPPVNEQCTVVPVDKPAPRYYPPSKPADAGKTKDPPREPEVGE